MEGEAAAALKEGKKSHGLIACEKEPQIEFPDVFLHGEEERSVSEVSVR